MGYYQQNIVQVAMISKKLFNVKREKSKQNQLNMLRKTALVNCEICNDFNLL